MGLLQILLIIATFLCTLVAGFLFAFAVVVMPGIKKLSDGEFIRAFQVMDGIIQDNQPLFVIVWLGSIFALVATAALGVVNLEGTKRMLLIAATLIYLFGVQAPTLAVNIPRNNALQAVNVQTASAPELSHAREQFEDSWNFANILRTFLACVTSALLIMLALKL